MLGLRASSRRAEDGRRVSRLIEFYHVFGRATLARLFMVLMVAPSAALIVTGCAQKKSPDVVMMKQHGSAHGHMPEPGRAYAEVDLEDDGREAQQPPLVMRKPEADDPSEPYSPNYGRVSAWEDGDRSKPFGAPAARRAGTHINYGATPEHTRGFQTVQRSLLR